MNTPKLIDQVRTAIRLKHYSLRTEEAYWHWIKRFILFHGKRHPDEMGEAEISAFLSHLAVDKRVAASTQNQALSALHFLTMKCSSRLWIGSKASNARNDPQDYPLCLPEKRSRQFYETSTEPNG